MTLPGRPGGDRPDNILPERPGRPGGGRPDISLPGRPGRPGGARPGIGDRPINIGDINIGNKVINNRPSWVNIDRDKIVNINNRWQNQIGGIQNWQNRHPERRDYWRGWGDGVRHHWQHYHRHDYWFGPNWWTSHRHGCGGWHYGYRFGSHPWSYWWTVPTFAACTSWFTWSAPATVWAQPIYYDYGPGGNVVYENNLVYVNGEEIGTAEEYAQNAAVLATVPPPADEQQAEAAEWMPLGTFAVTSNEKDVDPTRVIQLAVSKEGVISGTLYNTQTDQADTIQGRVDPNTQRVAFRIGESEDIVAETGIYNLTQDDAPLLVHFGTERVENWLLVRLENPEDQPE